MYIVLATYHDFVGPQYRAYSWDGEKESLKDVLKQFDDLLHLDDDGNIFDIDKIIEELDKHEEYLQEDDEIALGIFILDTDHLG